MILENYLKYIQEAGEGSFKMYQKYGAVALLTVAPSTIYNYLFREFKDRCVKRCKSFQTDPICWYGCYLQAIVTVVSAIRRDQGKIGTIPDKRERDYLRKKLDMELERWEKKEEKIRERLDRVREEE